MLTKRYKLLIAAILGGVALYAVVFYFVVAGQPYATARSFIESNPIVAKELGQVSDVGLSWLSSASISGNSGSGELRCPVEGTTRKGIVYLDLERRAGAWNVIRANLRVDGRTVPLL